MPINWDTYNESKKKAEARLDLSRYPAVSPIDFSQPAQPDGNLFGLTPEEIRQQEVQRMAAEEGQQVAEAATSIDKMKDSGFIGDTIQRWRLARRSFDLDKEIGLLGAMGNSEEADRLSGIADRIDQLRAEAAKDDSSKFFGTMADLVAPIVETMTDGLKVAVPAGVATSMMGAGAGSVGGPGGAGLGAGGGFAVGFGKGLAVSGVEQWSRQGMGTIYRELRREKIDAQHARPVSIAGGIVYGLIEHATRFLPEPLQKAALDPIKLNLRRKMTQTALRMAGKRVVDAINESGEEAAQSAVVDIAKNWAIDLAEGLDEDGNPVAKVTGSDIFLKAIDDAASAFLPTLVLGTATRGIGEYRAQKSFQSAVAPIEKALGYDDAKAESEFRVIADKVSKGQIKDTDGKPFTDPGKAYLQEIKKRQADIEAGLANEQQKEATRQIENKRKAATDAFAKINLHVADQTMTADAFSTEIERVAKELHDAVLPGKQLDEGQTFTQWMTEEYPDTKKEIDAQLESRRIADARAKVDELVSLATQTYPGMSKDQVSKIRSSAITEVLAEYEKNGVTLSRSDIANVKRETSMDTAKRINEKNKAKGIVTPPAAPLAEEEPTKPEEEAIAQEVSINDKVYRKQKNSGWREIDPVSDKAVGPTISEMGRFTQLYDAIEEEAGSSPTAFKTGVDHLNDLLTQMEVSEGRRPAVLLGDKPSKAGSLGKKQEAAKVPASAQAQPETAPTQSVEQPAIVAGEAPAPSAGQPQVEAPSIQPEPSTQATTTPSPVPTKEEVVAADKPKMPDLTKKRKAKIDKLRESRKRMVTKMNPQLSELEVDAIVDDVTAISEESRSPSQKANAPFAIALTVRARAQSAPATAEEIRKEVRSRFGVRVDNASVVAMLDKMVEVKQLAKDDDGKYLVPDKGIVTVEITDPVTGKKTTQPYDRSGDIDGTRTATSKTMEAVRVVSAHPWATRALTAFGELMGVLKGPRMVSDKTVDHVAKMIDKTISSKTGMLLSEDDLTILRNDLRGIADRQGGPTTTEQLERIVSRTLDRHAKHVLKHSGEVTAFNKAIEANDKTDEQKGLALMQTKKVLDVLDKLGKVAGEVSYGEIINAFGQYLYSTDGVVDKAAYAKWKSELIDRMRTDLALEASLIKTVESGNEDAAKNLDEVQKRNIQHIRDAVARYAQDIDRVALFQQWINTEMIEAKGDTQEERKSNAFHSLRNRIIEHRQRGALQGVVGIPDLSGKFIGNAKGVTSGKKVIAKEIAKTFSSNASIIALQHRIASRAGSEWIGQDNQYAMDALTREISDAVTGGVLEEEYNKVANGPKRGELTAQAEALADQRIAAIGTPKDRSRQEIVDEFFSDLVIEELVSSASNEDSKLFGWSQGLNDNIMREVRRERAANKMELLSGRKGDAEIVLKADALADVKRVLMGVYHRIKGMGKISNLHAIRINANPKALDDTIPVYEEETSFRRSDETESAIKQVLLPYINAIRNAKKGESLDGIPPELAASLAKDGKISEAIEQSINKKDGMLDQLREIDRLTSKMSSESAELKAAKARLDAANDQIAKTGKVKTKTGFKEAKSAEAKAFIDSLRSAIDAAKKAKERENERIGLEVAEISKSVEKRIFRLEEIAGRKLFNVRVKMGTAIRNGQILRIIEKNRTRRGRLLGPLDVISEETVQALMKAEDAVFDAAGVDGKSLRQMIEADVQSALREKKILMDGIDEAISNAGAGKSLSDVFSYINFKSLSPSREKALKQAIVRAYWAAVRKHIPTVLLQQNTTVDSDRIDDFFNLASEDAGLTLSDVQLQELQDARRRVSELNESDLSRIKVQLEGDQGVTIKSLLSELLDAYSSGIGENVDQGVIDRVNIVLDAIDTYKDARASNQLGAIGRSAGIVQLTVKEASDLLFGIIAKREAALFRTGGDNRSPINRGRKTNLPKAGEAGPRDLGTFEIPSAGKFKTVSTGMGPLPVAQAIPQKGNEDLGVTPKDLKEDEVAAKPLRVDGLTERERAIRKSQELVDYAAGRIQLLERLRDEYRKAGNEAKAKEMDARISGLRSAKADEARADMKNPENRRFQPVSTTDGNPADKQSVSRWMRDAIGSIPGATVTLDRTGSDVVGTARVGSKVIRFVMADDITASDGTRKRGAVEVGAAADYTILISKKDGNMSTPRHEVGHIVFDSLTDLQKQTLDRVLGFKTDTIENEERFVRENLETDEARMALADKILASTPNDRNIIARAINAFIRGINALLGTNLKPLNLGAGVGRLTAEDLADGLKNLSILKQSVGDGQVWQRFQTAPSTQQAAGSTGLSYDDFRSNNLSGGKWSTKEGREFLAAYHARADKSQTSLRDFYESTYSLPTAERQVSQVIEKNLNKREDVSNKTLLSRVKNGAKNLALGGMNVRTIARWIDGTLGDEVEQATDATRAVDIQRNVEFMLRGSKAHDHVRAIRQADDVSDNIGGLMAGPIKMSKAQQYSLVRLAKNKAARDAMFDGGIRLDDRSTVYGKTIPFLTDDRETFHSKIEAWADSKLRDPDFKGLFEAHDKMTDFLFVEMNSVYKRMVPQDEWVTPEGLSKAEHYIFLERDMGENVDTSSRSDFARIIGRWKSLQKRVRNQNAVIVSDGAYSMINSAYTASRFIGFAEQMSRLRRILGYRYDNDEGTPSQVARLINNKYGNGTWEMLKEGIDQIEGKAYEEDNPPMRLLSRLMRWSDIHRLGGPKTPIVQLSALATPLLKYDAATVMAGYASKVSAKDLEDYITADPRGSMLALRLQQQNSAFEEMHEGLSMSDTKLSPKVREIRQGMYGLIRRMDRFTVKAHLKVAWEHVNRTMPTATLEDRKKAFVNEANDLLQFQPSGDKSMRAIYHNKGVRGAALYRWATTINAQAFKIAEMYMKAKTPEEKRVVLGRMFQTIALQTVFISFVDSGYEWAKDQLVEAFGDEEDKKKILDRRKEEAEMKTATVIRKLATTASGQLPIPSIMKDAIGTAIEIATTNRDKMVRYKTMDTGLRTDPRFQMYRQLMNTQNLVSDYLDISQKADEEGWSKELRQRQNRLMRATYKNALGYISISPVPVPVEIWSNFLSLDKALFNLAEVK